MSAVRVLVVDDQDPFRRAAAAVLDSMDGFDLVGAVASGEESLTAVADLRPDLVLMDVNLPGLDGLEATRRIRLRDDPPIVVLVSTYERSDYGDPADPADLCGADSYLTKSAFDADSVQRVWEEARV